MGRTLLAAAALIVGMSMTCEAGSFDDGYALEPSYRHHMRRAHAYRRFPAKPYHMGVGGLIVVHEPYGAWIYERAVRTREGIIWGR